MFDLNQSQALLVGSLSAINSEKNFRVAQADFISRYQKIDGQEFYNFARLNRSIPTVAHGLLNFKPELSLTQKWQQAHDHSIKVIKSYLAELDGVAELLSAGGIPMVALKNAGIARGIYPCLGCCPMGDLDVLVRPSDFRQAHKILTDNGFILETRCSLEEADIDSAEQSGGAEYRKKLANGDTLWFELQWRPVAGRWIRPDQEPSADELMESSIEIPGTAVRLLSPEDNLLQVALHTAKHTYVRAPGVRLHTDVDRIVAFQKINWEAFTQKIEQFKVKTAVYFSLVIPKELFGTAIPDEVTETIKPSSWKVWLISRWLNKVGLFNPDERKFGKLGYIVFNCLLYDSFFDLFRGILPSPRWLKEHYKFESNLLLPFYYVKRVANLAFKRVM